MSENTNRGGIGFAGMLTIVFIALKLTGHINWNWVWVLSPILISIGLAILILLIGLVVIYIQHNKRR